MKFISLFHFPFILFASTCGIEYIFMEGNVDWYVNLIFAWGAFSAMIYSKL